MNQKGFTYIFIVAAILIVGGATILLLFKQNSSLNNIKMETVKNVLKNGSNLYDDEPPLKLKSIGVEFSDFKYTKAKLQFNRLFMDYGFFIPASSVSSDKKNPQPTYILPLGTPVRSLVDGVVANMPTLWSNDLSIQVTTDGKMQRWVYEVEHVMNPKVKVGDKVTAGQIIAEVSNFDKGAPAGFGAVEIGILKGGNPPQHVCPFAYLDDSVKEEVFKNMNDLFRSWEDYVGDNTLYPETTIPGCLTLDPIDG